jgi:hypothetical protein
MVKPTKSKVFSIQKIENNDENDGNYINKIIGGTKEFAIKKSVKKLVITLKYINFANLEFLASYLLHNHPRLNCLNILRSSSSSKFIHDNFVLDKDSREVLLLNSDLLKSRKNKDSNFEFGPFSTQLIVDRNVKIYLH